MSEAPQCQETVRVRDTWRYSGRGRGGFSMHYRRQQCRRLTANANGYCWQHQPRVALAAEPRAPRDGEGE